MERSKSRAHIKRRGISLYKIL